MQFDVSLPEKILKIVATRGEIFSLKVVKYRLASGLRPDTLVEKVELSLCQWRRQTRGIGCVRAPPVTKMHNIFKQDSAEEEEDNLG